MENQSAQHRSPWNLETKNSFLLISWFPVVFVFSCSPRMESISARDPGMFEKVESGPMEGFARPLGDPVAPPEYYVKHTEVRAKAVSRGAETGSLFNPEDERNHLFAAMPLHAGSVLVLKIASNRQGSAPASPGAKSGKAKSDSGDKGLTPGKSGSGNEIEDALVKDLPDLAPADKSSAVITQMNVEVTHVDENGDAHVIFRRRSVLGEQAHEIRFVAKVPYARIASGEQLSTKDLAGVEWIESSDGQIIERKSSGWEDEYSMRVSGFDEARSKSAMALEEKRKQLLDVRNRLDTRLKTFAEERAQMAKQREELLAKEKDKETRIADLQGTVEKQKDELERLKPSEETEAKLGDSKDGKNGKK